MSSYASVGANLPAPQTDDQLRKTAASQVDLEINQSVAPIQSQIDITQGREDKSLGQISGMFDAIQPTVNQAAQAVQQGYNQAEFNQNQIFAQAQANLQQLRGNQAAEAQQLAQQIGGPVAMDQFTQPYDAASQDLTYLGAGQELHTLMYAQAGEQAAQQFAGQIFPLVRTEQMASARNQFEDQISQYEDQITSLKSQRGAQINSRFNDLRTQELQYGMQRAQLQLQKIDDLKNYNLQVRKAKDDRVAATRTYNLDKQQLGLDRTKANRDYEIAKRNAGNDEKQTAIAEKNYQLDLAKMAADESGTYQGKPTLAAKQLNADIKKANRDYQVALISAKQNQESIDIAKKNYELAVGEAIGKYKGVPTLDAQKLAEDAKESMRAYGLSDKELDAKIAQMKANTKIEMKKFHSDQRTEWAGLIDNAINPKPGQTVTNSIRVPATQYDLIHNPDVFQDADSATGYSKIIETHQTQQISQPITDPTRLVDYLLKVVDDPDMTKSRAIQLVKARMPNLPDNWKYGDKWPPKGAVKKPATKPDTAAARAKAYYKTHTPPHPPGSGAKTAAGQKLANPTLTEAGS
jgi:hypothetical protein